MNCHNNRSGHQQVAGRKFRIAGNDQPQFAQSGKVIRCGNIGRMQFAAVECREFFKRNLGSWIETESAGGHIGNRKIHKKDCSPEKLTVSSSFQTLSDHFQKHYDL